MIYLRHTISDYDMKDSVVCHNSEVISCTCIFLSHWQVPPVLGHQGSRLCL